MPLLPPLGTFPCVYEMKTRSRGTKYLSSSASHRVIRFDPVDGNGRLVDERAALDVVAARRGKSIGCIFGEVSFNTLQILVSHWTELLQRLSASCARGWTEPCVSPKMSWTH